MKRMFRKILANQLVRTAIFSAISEEVSLYTRAFLKVVKEKMNLVEDEKPKELVFTYVDSVTIDDFK